MRYLVIAPPGDSCARRVADTLGGDGHEVLVVSEPLVGRSTFNWRLSTQQSCWSLSFDGMDEEISASSLRGVYVRGYHGPLCQGDWVTDERTDVFAEAQAALLAWLSALECRVVNRPTAATWFRPQRPYPEWQMLFSRCGLPTLAALVTSNCDSARDFARRCGGAVTYTPMTSATRYPLQEEEEEEEWERLAKLMRVLPVCLIERPREIGGSAWVVGRNVVWDTQELELSCRLRFEDGVLMLAKHLAFDSFEIHYSGGTEGWCCSGIDLRPSLERYGSEAQERIVQCLRTLLECAA
jgi:hypothetical protein